jgi:hypothetical protein
VTRVCLAFISTGLPGPVQIVIERKEEFTLTDVAIVQIHSKDQVKIVITATFGAAHPSDVVELYWEGTVVTSAIVRGTSGALELHFTVKHPLLW